MLLPINIISDELRFKQSGIFDMFILDRIDPELHSLKHLELKFGLSLEFSEFFDKIPFRILLDMMCSFVCLAFLSNLLMP